MKSTLKCILGYRIYGSVMVSFIVAVLSFQISYAETLQQELIEVQGTVSDATTGESLTGVSVVVFGTATGTITDENGRYSIEVSPEAVLQFSFVGYLTEEMAVNNTTVLDVQLAVDLIGLEEITVVGYGVQKKSDLTGAISTVTGDKVNNIPVVGIDQALQGRAAGVTILNKSGRPGEGVEIQIRGISSINGTQPLVIVDGVPSSLDGLNPNDIESIEILKDASSAAIYGSTGGNGVILVTTKKGTSGGVKTSFNFYRGVENPTHKLELMNSQEWMEVLEEQDAHILEAKTLQPDTLPTYDWQDIIFKPAISESYDLSVSGGNDVSTYMVSGSYLRQEGIMKTSNYERLTFRINSEHKLSPRITFDEKIFYTNVNTGGFKEWEWHQYYNTPIRIGLLMAPYLPAYDENGDWSISDYGGDNPLVMLDMKNRRIKSNNFDINTGFNIELLKGLKYTTRVAASLSYDDAKEYKAVYWASTVDNRTQDELSGQFDKSLALTFQNFVNYTVQIAGKHNLNLMAGTEAYQIKDNSITGLRLDIPENTPDMLYFSASTNDTIQSQFIEEIGSERRTLAYFGRLNYDFMGKYLLTVNVRRDGSSSFGPKNRWGLFPSFSVGWKFTEEAFMDNIEFISFGKIRYGYGQTGTNARSGFPYLTPIRFPNTFTYPMNNEVSISGAAPVQIPNEEIKWETVIMSNLGLDLAFLENRLTLSVDYFSKVNDGLLTYLNVPSTTGSFSLGPTFEVDQTRPEVNIGSIKNTGVEITVGARKMEGELKGGIDLNVTFIKNEVIDLEVDSLNAGSVHILSPITLTREGSPIAELIGFRTEGLFTEDDPTEIIDGDEVITNQPYYIDEVTGDPVYAQPDAQPGDIRYSDVNGDGIISDEDKVVLGNPIPDVTFGFSINLAYKNFDFSAFFNGTLGNQLFNGTKQYLYYSQGGGNRAKDYTNRYRDEIIKEGLVVVTENHNTDMPSGLSKNYNRPREFFVENASYLRLRNLTLGYTIPNNITSRVGVSKFRVYVGAKNLFTLTKYEGMNPEAYTNFNPDGGNTDILDMGTDFGVYPLTRTLLFGANLVF